MMTEALGASYQRYRQRKARVAPGLWWRSADQR
jgi:protein-S-isoprenylcysteine O-methyltransferase Ste14